MNRSLLLIGFLMLVFAGTTVGQTSQIIVPYLSTGYKYQFAKATATIITSGSFKNPSSSETGYSTGTAAFGTLNTSTVICPLNDTAHIHTTWKASYSVIFRKHITLQAGARGLKVYAATDNHIDFYFNGVNISGGEQQGNSCATQAGNFMFSVPDSLLKVGDNLLAAEGEWRSGSNYLDCQVTGITSYTITASAGSNGQISPGGAVSVSSGGTAIFTITANTGYHVQTVTIDNIPGTVATSLSAPASIADTFKNVTANHTISVIFALNRYIITATSGANGSISPSGADTVGYGSSPSFTFLPATGYHVDSLIVDGIKQPSALAYAFSNVTANHTIRVTFAINQFTITASAGPNGSIAPSGSITVNYGANQGFAFTPATGYHLDSLIVDGVSIPPAPADTLFNVTTNHTIRVTFAINQYTIVASSGANGSITPNGSITVNYGANQPFAVTPATGYHIDSLIVDGVSIPPASTDTFFNVTANHTIRVTFAINLYTISTSAGSNGSITPAGPLSVPFGGMAIFLIQANSSYHVDSIQIDNNTTLSVATSQSTPVQISDTFQNVSANHTLRATFARNQYTLSTIIDTYPPTGNTSVGSASLVPAKSLYTPGDSVTLTAFAAPGYHFVQWLFPDSTKPTANPLKVAVNGNLLVTAAFAPNVPLQIVVNTLADTVDPNDGKTSLREAIIMTNANPGTDGISFDITVGNTPGSKIIQLHQPLPPFTDGIDLDFSALLDSTGKPTITLQPTYAPSAYPNSNGLDLGGAFLPFGYTPHGSIIRGLIITGFPGAGICIHSDSNIVQQNIITANGGHGICIEDGNDNTIGNSLTTAIPNGGNTISSNGLDGIVIQEVSTIDTIPPPAGNTILGNSLYANGQLGIDLGGTGAVKLNRYPGGPTSPLIRPQTPDAINFGVNYPSINVATVGGATPSTVAGYLLSWRSTTFRIEVFLNDSANHSGYGEGKTLIGSATVVTDNDSAYAWFSITSSVPLQFGQFVSATATDQFGNTSEFSQVFPVGLETRIFQSDQFVVNKTLSGIPLHWPDGRGTFSLANSVAASGFQAPIESSFVAWNEQAVKPDLTPLVSYAKVAPLTSTEQWGGYPDGVNNVVWVTNNWGQATGAPDQVIAVTRVRYNAYNGEMTDVDMAFNAQTFSFGNATDPNSPGGIKDMQDVATHEVGHFGGLGDMYVPGYPGWDIRMGAQGAHLTMFGIIRNDETEKRSLETGDINGINYIYSHVKKSALDLVLLFDGSPAFDAKYNAFNPSKNSATELLYKLRQYDRVAVIKLPDTVVVPLTTIDTTNIASVVNAIQGISLAGTSAIGAGLQKAVTVLNVANPNRRAVILYSAGEETGSPTALSAVPGIIADSATVFTMGFDGSTGQALNSTLADTSGGNYYLAADTTISLVVHQIWNQLTGLQAIADTGVFAGQGGLNWQGGFNWQGGLNWQGGFNWQGGLNWQGAVDPGTVAILPGLNWQGSTFVLFLIPPGYPIPTGVTDGTNMPSYVITPDHLPPGAKYIEGPTYAFYKIPNPAPGKWILHPEGANSNVPEPKPEPVSINITAATDVIMAVSFDHDTYKPGNVIQFQAALSEGGAVIGSEHLSGGQPITNASVTAIVKIPGDTVSHIVTMSHIGNGIYTGSFSNTAAQGSYDFTIVATGTTAALPQGFNRKSEQSVFVSPTFLNAVIFASESATIQSRSQITSGSILVNRKALPGEQSYQLTIASGVTTPAGFDIKADRISVASGSIIGSNVYYNVLTNSGTINGSKFTPLTLPVGQFPPFLTADSAAERARSYSLGTGKTDTLRPGIYGNVTLQPSSNLILVSGVYHFRSLWMKSGAKMSGTGNSMIQVRTLHGVEADNGTFIGPAAGSVLRPSDIFIYVASTDPHSEESSVAVNISPKSTVAANIFAVNGTVSINQSSTATGAFFGKVVRIGSGVKLTLASGFSASSTTPKAVPGLEVSGSAGSLPVSYDLSQNYPNPFNPTTVIRYALPQASPVTLTIYNVLGQEIARLVDGPQPAGRHEVLWNGRNGSGASVSSGMYFYRIQAGTFVNVKKMVLMK